MAFSPKFVSKMFPKLPKNVTQNVPKVSKNVPKMSKNTPRMVPKLSKNFNKKNFSEKILLLIKFTLKLKIQSRL